MTDQKLPRVLVCHPGASWSTADVYNGLRFGLSACNVQTSAYQLDVRITRSAQWLHWNWRKSGKPGGDAGKPNARDIGYHAGVGLIERALRIEPDWILIVSGMYLDLDIVQYLRRCGFKIACLLTESPYDDLRQAEYIRNVDVAWTNERTSVARLRAAAPRTRVRYLGHAWHPLVHLAQPPLPTTEVWDALFVGTGFPERVDLLRDVRWPDPARVALYGHWDTLGSRSKLRRLLRGKVLENEQAAELYRAAKVNLNLMRRRLGHAGPPGTEGGGGEVFEVIAESVNPRCMELAAMACFFVSDPRPELHELFGGLVPTFQSAEELSDLLDEWLHPHAAKTREERGWLLQQCAQGHSWIDRAKVVLEDLVAGPLALEPTPDAPRLHLAVAPV